MNLIREYVRNSLIAESDRHILEENALKKVTDWISEKGSKGNAMLKQFMTDFKTELEETGIGVLILKKLSLGEDLNPEEQAFLKDQVADVTKGGFLAGLFILPGGGLASAALVKIAKKYNIDLMPSAMNNRQRNTK